MKTITCLLLLFVSLQGYSQGFLSSPAQQPMGLQTFSALPIEQSGHDAVTVMAVSRSQAELLATLRVNAPQTLRMSLSTDPAFGRIVFQTSFQARPGRENRFHIPQQAVIAEELWYRFELDDGQVITGVVYAPVPRSNPRH